MLFQVAATGMFTKAKGMNDWTEGADGIPTGWNVSERLRQARAVKEHILVTTICQCRGGQLDIERSSFSNWEAGRRLPDIAMIPRIAKALGVDVAVLLSAAESPDESPNVLLVDDKSIILDGSLPVLREALPGANVFGFTKPAQTVDFVRNHPVALIFLDIELGRMTVL